MGALFGAILQDGGHRVTLFDADAEHIAAIQKDGLHIKGFGGDRTVHINAVSDAAEITRADAVLFQCKAHGTRAAAHAVRHLVEGGAVCISFQNGLGNEEMIAAELGEQNVLGGLTTMAGLKLGPGVVQDFSRVPSYIGEMSGEITPRAERVARLFTEAGLETSAKANIRTEIWKKLMGNISMSAVSGATNLTAATLMSTPSLRALCMRAMDEAFAVARSQGIELSRDEVVSGMEMISTPGGTGDNKSSLCVDILNRRPTEVGVIYGTVIDLANSSTIPVPTLETLAAIVRGLESHYMNGEAT